MAAQSDPNEICERLLRILTEEPVVLFAGAGVGVRAGLPDWRNYLSHLISVAEQYEKETALIMRSRASENRFADSAHYYKICPHIPQGEKYAQLARPFEQGKFDATKLNPLMNLGFEAIVTTNYDRSLHDSSAAVSRKAPRPFELDDGSLRQAPYCNEFYIARLHGRAEIAESMVVDTDDFAKLDSNSFYKDFLCQNILTKKTCLFVGFSFFDPAINKILELLERLVGPRYPRKHYALVPSNDTELAIRLAQFNIEAIKYDNHDTLWKCIESLPLKLVEAKKPVAVATAPTFPFESMHLFLASCYVRAKMSEAATPLRDLILQGIVLGMVEKSAGKASIQSISERLREVIPLSHEDAHLIVSKAISSLAEKGWARTINGEIELARLPEKILEQNLEVLVRGTLNRLIVREGIKEKPTYAEAVRRTLEEIFLSRGWDLGAEFVGARPHPTVDLFDHIKKLLRSLLSKDSFANQDHLSRAVYELLRRPDDVEARILSDVARLSFGLNVLLKLGNSALKLEALPERLYLDASIVMPAITEGHPFRPVYQSVISKLSEELGEAGKVCELLVVTDFLNEIVSHKKLGSRIVEELGLEDPVRLEKHILYYGAENTNVFVGAYASWVGREKKAVPFDEFLKVAAPYTDELGLASFLERLGIRTVSVSEHDASFQELHRNFSRTLSQAYAHFREIGWFREKARILIEHEARQLAQIELELKQGWRSYFVTADKGLREILALTRPGMAWNVVISHLGLVQLIDLLLGVDVEPRSLARLLWGIMEVDEHASLRNYFVDLALKRRDEALVMTLPEIIDRFVEDAERAAKLERVKFFTKSVEDKAKAARFLDRFEENFFAGMAEVVQRRRKQNL